MGDDNQGEPVTAASLRERALRARRLSRGWLTEADRRLFIDLADKLEAEAAELEKALVGQTLNLLFVIPDEPALSASVRAPGSPVGIDGQQCPTIT